MTAYWLQPAVQQASGLDHEFADLPGFPRRPRLHSGEVRSGVRPLDLDHRCVAFGLPDGDDDLAGRAIVGFGPEARDGRAVVQHHYADHPGALGPVVRGVGWVMFGAPGGAQRASARVHGHGPTTVAGSMPDTRRQALELPP